MNAPCDNIKSGSVFFMNLEIKKLKEQWEYIQGGFLFLEESGAEEVKGALALANGELRYYIGTLSAVDQKAEALRLGLELIDPSVSFEEIPASLRLMTDQDIAFAREEGGMIDGAYGCVALAQFYGYVRDFLQFPSVTPGKMKEYIREKVSSCTENIGVSFN